MPRINLMFFQKVFDKMMLQGLDELLSEEQPKHQMEVPPSKGALPSNKKQEGRQSGPQFSTLRHPVGVVEVAQTVGQAAGRPDKLAEKMRARGLVIAKSADKNYCELDDAIKMFPKMKNRLLANFADLSDSDNASSDRLS